VDKLSWESMAGNRWMRVYSPVESGLLALIRATSSTIQPYTDATVASSTGTNGQSRLHWTQQQDSPQVDGTLLLRHSLDTADTWLKDLVRTARLSSPGSTQTNNHSSPQRSLLALGKVQSAYPVTPHNQPQEQHGIRHRRMRTMDRWLATMDTAKHPRTGRTPDKSHHDILITLDVIHQGRARLGEAHTANDSIFPAALDFVYLNSTF